MRFTGRFLILAGLAGTALATVACDGITETPCTPGAAAAVEAWVRTPEGVFTSVGSTIVATTATSADTVGPIVWPYHAEESPVWIGSRGGTYTVTASKPHWSTATATVTVGEAGRCNYPQTKTVALEMRLLPDAPPVRSVAIAPRWVRFTSCGAQGTAAAYVDAAPGLSEQVLWRSADTTIATINDAGRVTSKRRGSTVITARAVADTTVEGRMPVTVDATCA